WSNKRGSDASNVTTGNLLLLEKISRKPSRVSLNLHLRPELSLLLAHEVSGAAGVDQVRIERDALHVVLGDIDHLVDDVARMAHAHRAFERLVPFLDQVIDPLLVVFYFASLADELPDLPPLPFARVAHFDLEFDAAKER